MVTCCDPAEVAEVAEVAEDDPATWWGSFGNQRDPYVAFKNAYGDDYDTFERYATEFFQWRANKVPMSQELLSRLR